MTGGVFLASDTRTSCWFPVHWIYFLFIFLHFIDQYRSDWRPKESDEKSICSLKTCSDAFVTYDDDDDDVETKKQIFGGKYPICLPTQASWL